MEVRIGWIRQRYFNLTGSACSVEVNNEIKYPLFQLLFSISKFRPWLMFTGGGGDT